MFSHIIHSRPWHTQGKADPGTFIAEQKYKDRQTTSAFTLPLSRLATLIISCRERLAKGFYHHYHHLRHRYYRYHYRRPT